MDALLLFSVVTDVNGDQVRCRWAAAAFGECGGICDSPEDGNPGSPTSTFGFRLDQV